MLNKNAVYRIKSTRSSELDVERSSAPTEPQDNEREVGIFIPFRAALLEFESTGSAFCLFVLAERICLFVLAPAERMDYVSTDLGPNSMKFGGTVPWSRFSYGGCLLFYLLFYCALGLSLSAHCCFACSVSVALYPWQEIQTSASRRKRPSKQRP
jgi:hypothetical protein